MSSSIEIKNEDFLRIFLIIWMIGSLISFILLFFLPDVVANSSVWELSLGWQRELAFWSIGMIFAIIYALYLNKVEISKYLTLVLVILSGIIGSNHLIALILNSSFHLIDFFWIMGNYFSVGFGAYAFYLNKGNSF